MRSPIVRLLQEKVVEENSPVYHCKYNHGDIPWWAVLSMCIKKKPSGQHPGQHLFIFTDCCFWSNLRYFFFLSRMNLIFYIQWEVRLLRKLLFYSTFLVENMAVWFQKWLDDAEQNKQRKKTLLITMGVLGVCPSCLFFPLPSCCDRCFLLLRLFLCPCEL